MGDGPDADLGRQLARLSCQKGNSDSQREAVALLAQLNRLLAANRDSGLEEHYLSMAITLVNDLKRMLVTLDDQTLTILQHPLRLLVSSKAESGPNGPAIMFFASVVLGVLFRFRRFPQAINLHKVLVNVKFDTSLCDPTSVLYKFNMGRCLVVEGQYLQAHETLLACWSLAPAKLRFKLAVYLFPLHMVLYNEVPKRHLFDTYPLLLVLLPLYESIGKLDVGAYNSALVALQHTLLRANVYSLYVEMGDLLELRVFRRRAEVWQGLAEANGHIVPLDVFAYSKDVDREYVETKLMGFIAGGRVKGYLSHGKGVVVLSKKEAFPSFNS